MSKILIHQPEYLPWTHLFEKIKLSDVFVFLDNVQYNRRSYQNRNEIKTQHGRKWLTVPLKYSSREELISNILIDNSQNWKKQHLSLIENNYSKSIFFNEIFQVIKLVLENNYDYLCDLNIDLIKNICNLLSIKCDFLLLSEMNIESKKSDLILDICLSLNSKEYVTGIGSKKYLKQNDFDKNNIKINFYKSKNKKYDQLFPEKGFVNNLSVIDKIFNKGFNIL